MKTYLKPIIGLAALAAAAVMFTGCDDYNNDDNDHTPPDGQGSIIVNNHTYEDIAVFIDGERQEKDAGDRNDRAYNLDPGVYRIILDQRGGDRTFRDDIDVIANRNTILDVTNDPFDNTRYDVAVFFETP